MYEYVLLKLFFGFALLFYSDSSTEIRKNPSGSVVRISRPNTETGGQKQGCNLLATTEVGVFPPLSKLTKLGIGVLETSDNPQANFDHLTSPNVLHEDNNRIKELAASLFFCEKL